MRVLVATVGTPFVHGGAEVLADELVRAFVTEGHEAALVSIPFNPGRPESIPDQMLACRLLDLREIHAAPVDRLIALKFPAYLISHPAKVVWLLHQHRSAYDLWDTPMGDLHTNPRGRMLREVIARADQQIGDEARAVFTISQNVSRRLQHYSQIASTPLYHPPAKAAAFYAAEKVEDYFFFPSRLSANKRQELVLRALAHTRQPVRVKFSGLPDSPSYGEHLRRLALKLKVEAKVEWMGYLGEIEKVDAYARALAVVFPPLDEDYGYVTLEAMLASKAVITCRDSGGTLEFIVPGQTGLAVDPTAEDLALAMDELWQDRARAQEYGQKARQRYDSLGLSWSHVVKTLLG
ncbi:MAG: glycosyltransferase family 4 protein [Chthoniobacterales bacterium]